MLMKLKFFVELLNGVNYGNDTITWVQTNLA